MNNELMAWLGETTLATSAALLLVLLLRRSMRTAFGSGAAYALWALVPIALIAVLLPAPVHPVVLMPMAGRTGAVQVMTPAPVQSSVPWALVLVTAWGAGAVAMAALQLWQQHRFLRRIGPLRIHAHGLRVAATSMGLPAVAGVLRPRIVLPADFLVRYDADERALVVAHERQHIARGDLPCNALVALLRCVYWFNPLLHWAVARYRHDQELACDARVLRRHPHARRAYAQAMLKTQLDDFALPVGCHWHTHPLKERIAMLKHPSPRRWQNGLSSALLLALFAGGGYAAWAQQPAAAASASGNGELRYSTSFDVSADGERHHFEMRGAAHVPMGFTVDTKAGHHWRGEFTLEPNGRQIVIQSVVSGGEAGAMSRELQAPLGQRTTMKFDSRRADGTPKADFGVAIIVNELGDVGTDGPASPVAAAAKEQVAGALSEATPPYGADRPPPRYPVEAARARIGGKVVVIAEYAADGHVTGATVEKSNPAGVFDEVSLEAIRKWTFKPAIEDGKPVAGRMRVPIDFEMDPPEKAPTSGGGAPSPAAGRKALASGGSMAKGDVCDAAAGRAGDVSGGTACGRGASHVGSKLRSDGKQVLFDVAADGAVSNVRLDTERKPGELERAMMQTLGKSRMAPAIKDGHAVEATFAADVTRGIPAPPGFMGTR